MCFPSHHTSFSQCPLQAETQYNDVWWESPTVRPQLTEKANACSFPSLLVVPPFIPQWPPSPFPSDLPPSLPPSPSLLQAFPVLFTYMSAWLNSVLGTWLCTWGQLPVCYKHIFCLLFPSSAVPYRSGSKRASFYINMSVHARKHVGATVQHLCACIHTHKHRNELTQMFT